MNAGGSPKPQKIAGPSKEVAVNQQATSLVRQGIKRKQGARATALAGETGGYEGGFAGSTALN